MTDTSDAFIGVVTEDDILILDGILNETGNLTRIRRCGSWCPAILLEKPSDLGVQRIPSHSASSVLRTYQNISCEKT